MIKIRFQLLTVFCVLSFLTFGQEGRFKKIETAISNAEIVTELWVSSSEDSIPLALLACKNLESIRFSSLNVNFDIESALEILSKLSSLKEVLFWNFKASEPPKNLILLNQITHIEFYNSPSLHLGMYFESLESLPKLERLSLGNMQLKSIPIEITKLKNLNYLNLDNNDQLDLPQLFSVLSLLKIEELNLSSAKFDVIPHDIIRLKQLKVLTLEMIQGDFNNKETYMILSKLEKLENLNLQGNFLRVFDPSITLLKHLKRLEIDGNCLSKKEFKKLKKYLPTTEIQNEIPC